MLKKAYMALSMCAAAAIISLGMYFGFAGDSVSAAVYPKRFSFGERAVLKVTARGGCDTDIELAGQQGVLDGFVRMREGSVESVFLWRKRKVMWWSFTSEITGDHRIPAVAVRFTGLDGRVAELKTDPASFTVRTLVDLKEDALYSTRIGGEMVTGKGSTAGNGGSLRSVDGAVRIKIRDERSPVGIADNDELLITVGACILGVLAVYIVFVVMSRFGGKKIILPPDKALLARLDKLLPRLATGEEARRELYYELSAAMREYLKAMLHISGQEPTTKELLDMIDRSDAIETSKRMSYKELLKVCDAMKYSASIDTDTGRLRANIDTLRALAVPYEAAVGNQGGDAG